MISAWLCAGAAGLVAAGSDVNRLLIAGRRAAFHISQAGRQVAGMDSATVKGDVIAVDAFSANGPLRT